MKNMKQTFYQKNKAAVYMLLIILAAATYLELSPPQKAESAEVTVIPNDAIRLRILANSDQDDDQEVKREIRDAVNEKITEWVGGLQDKNEARSVIGSRLPELEAVARQKLEERNLPYSAEIEFGDVQFPTKLYGQLLYPAGTYEAVLITLGEGKGANWWCVLYPPLCFLDISNGAAVSDGFEDQGPDMTEDEIPETAVTPDTPDTTDTPVFEGEEDEVEVRFFLKDLIDDIL